MFFANAVPANARVCSVHIVCQFCEIANVKKKIIYGIMPKGNEILTTRTKSIFAIRSTAPFSQLLEVSEINKTAHMLFRHLGH